MPEASLRRVLLHFEPDAAEAREPMVAALNETGWQPALLDGLVPGALARHLPAKVLLLVGEGEALASAAESVAHLHPELVILSLGARPLPRAHGWLRQRPSPELLDALLREWVGVKKPQGAAAAAPGAPQASRWRRKGDMILGRSRQVEELLKTLDRLAPSPQPVLVTGESGTGKELVARALHYCGPRVSGRFIALNCAAIPESLIEAELFGHERGAFTGAVTQRPGAFEAAHNGTLFLDEIGEMPIQHQAKLLRVLETSEVTRIGSNTAKAVNVRLVAASNRDLFKEQSAARFRQDLYYRLSVYPVHLAPLRERREDILPIADHQLSMIAEREKRPVPRLTAAAAERLLHHSWPGNVRELINVLERACLIAPNQLIESEHLALGPGAAEPEAQALDPLPYREAKVRFEVEYYQQLMRAAFGNVSKVAKLAGKTRKEVYDALKRLELDPEAFRQTG